MQYGKSLEKIDARVDNFPVDSTRHAWLVLSSVQMTPVRINNEIKAREVRVIGHDGKQLGIYLTGDALNLARAFGMDLVEIAASAAPPVVRIVDYKKFLEEQKKRAEPRDFSNN